MAKAIDKLAREPVAQQVPDHSPIRTETEWESIIRDDLNRAKEGAIQFLNGVISAGQNLSRAKQEIGHGRFGPLLVRLNINERTAQRLMNIGAHPTITNPAYAGLLPISMRTLSELATILPATLEGYIKDGVVHADIERGE